VQTNVGEEGSGGRAFVGVTPFLLEKANRLGLVRNKKMAVRSGCTCPVLTVCDCAPPRPTMPQFKTALSSLEANRNKLQRQLEQQDLSAPRRAKLEAELLTVTWAIRAALDDNDPAASLPPMSRKPLAAAHVADLSFPHGTTVKPRQPVSKVWRLRNVGSEAWPADVVLCMGGRESHAMGAEVVQHVAPCLSGDLTDVTVVCFLVHTTDTDTQTWCV